MKEIRIALVEVLVMFSKVYHKRTDAEIAELVPIWLAVIGGVEGVTPENLREAGFEVLKTCTDYWPKPATLREALLPLAAKERDRRFSESFALAQGPKSLPLPEKIMTPEDRPRVLSGMKAGARSLLHAILGERSSMDALDTEEGFKTARGG